MVLGRKEKVLMDVVYNYASHSVNGQCLVSSMDMLSKIPYKIDFREDDLEQTLNQLVLDDYFNYEKAKKNNGDIMYIITLRDNGISYQRDKAVSRRKLIFRIITTIIFASLSFSLKWILQAIVG